MPRQNGFTIRALRDKAGISTTEMARRLGPITPSHYRKIEDETRAATEAQLQVIATVLDMPVAALVRTPPNGGTTVSAADESVQA